MNRTLTVAALLALPISLLGCAHSGAGAPWAYSGERGPEKWGALAGDYAACGSGHRQSPVDLVGAELATLPPMVLQYQPSKATVRNTGHVVEVSVARGGTVSIGEHAYVLKHVDVHTPAEHTIGGERAPVELELVHADSAGALAVIGVMLRVGADHKGLGAILAALPPTEGQSRPLATPLDPSTLLPVEAQHFRYDGSLTAPPCTEGVTWMVMKSSIELSESQLAALRALHEGNARPLQPIGDRILSTDAN